MPGKPTRIAVDTNVLLDLALPRDLVHDAVELMRARVKPCLFVVPPTVLIELDRILRVTGSEDERGLAGLALDRMTAPWGFHPENLAPVALGIAGLIAIKIQEARLLPAEERNDSLLLAETALANCDLLLTSDNHLLDIPAERLRLLLSAQDAGCPIIVSPQRVVKDFFPRRR
jgi:predicted nucleic acid-binding protein